MYNGLLRFRLNECLDHEDWEMDVLSFEFRIGRRRVHTAVEQILSTSSQSRSERDKIVYPSWERLVTGDSWFENRSQICSVIR